MRKFLRPLAWLLVAALAGPALAAGDASDSLELTLRPGDTLIGIGERYLEQPARWTELQRLNRIINPRLLRPGASLRIPMALMRWSELPVEVVYVLGQVQGNRGALSAGMRLSSGDSFDTGAQGALTLRFADGALAVFAPGTQAVLGQSRQTPIGGVRATRIDLNRGAVETTVTPLDQPASRFDIRTPRVVTAVRGTRFRVAQDEQASRHEVLEGRVSAQAGAQAVDIGKGSGLRAQGAQLGAVVRLLPAPDLSGVAQRIERTAHMLQVPPMAGASGWRWQVASDAAFVQLLQSASTREPQWLFTGLPDGDYHLRVRAADVQELEGADGQTTLLLRARPEPPLKLSPPASANVLAGTPLAWAELPGAPTYIVQVARDAQFTNLVVDEAGVRGTRKTFDPALAPGTYHWRLATQRPDGSRGPFGDPSSFTVLEPSSVVPPQLGAGGLQLAWSGPAGFSQQVQVSLSADFAQTVFDQVFSGTSATLPDPKPGTYHVRTRIILPGGTDGPWSEVQRFEVPAPPEPPRPWYLLLFLLLPLL